MIADDGDGPASVGQLDQAPANPRAAAAVLDLRTVEKVHAQILIAADEVPEALLDAHTLVGLAEVTHHLIAGRCRC